MARAAKRKWGVRQIGPAAIPLFEFFGSRWGSLAIATALVAYGDRLYRDQFATTEVSAHPFRLIIQNAVSNHASPRRVMNKRNNLVKQ
jgi:hypothetical protein